MFQALLGGLASSYMSGALLGFGRISAAARIAGGRQPDFQQLMAEVGRNGKMQVELADLKHLEKTMREVAPEMFGQFKRDARKVGKPAVNEMRRTFRKINSRGPIWNKRNRGGRFYDSMYSSYVSNISWYQTKFQTGAKGIDVNYKNRRAGADLSRLRSGSDGTIGIVRIRVKSPAYIMADITGRGKRRQGTGSLSREYRIHAFGQTPYVTRRHRVNAENVQKWIGALNSGQGAAGSASRYAYPTMEKHAPKFAANVTTLLNGTIAELNRRMSA